MEPLAIALTTLGAVVAVAAGIAGLYGSVIALRNKGRYEALKQTIDLILPVNDELRAQVAELERKVSVLESDVIRKLIDTIGSVLRDEIRSIRGHSNA